MAYLVDTNVFVQAKKDYYRFGTFPGFWALMKRLAHDGTITSVEAVRREILARQDDLSSWIGAECPGHLFVPPDAATATAAGEVSKWAAGRTPQYRPDALATFYSAADYLIVAHARAHGHTVVTHELPSPQSLTKVKIPDACNALGVRWMNSYKMLELVGARF